MKKAAALAYNAEINNAPNLLAKGQGLIAQKIISKAKEFDIPLFMNAELVDSLMNVELESEIPPLLYEAVVNVFVWLNNIENEARMSGK